jgi:hypothetical protein
LALSPVVHAARTRTNPKRAGRTVMAQVEVQWSCRSPLPLRVDKEPARPGSRDRKCAWCRIPADAERSATLVDSCASDPRAVSNGALRAASLPRLQPLPQDESREATPCRRVREKGDRQ